MSRLRVVALLQVLVALVAVTACSGGDGGGDDKPSAAAVSFDAAGTLRQASAAMAKVTSTAFTVVTEDKPPILVKGGDLKLLKNGDAEGTLQIVQSGQTVELKIVALGDSVYIKGVTGGWRQLPKAMAAALYDPSAVLDPQRGIAKLLTTVSAPKAEAMEKVDGKDAYRIAVRLPKDAVGGLIPGIDSDIDGQVWVGKADHRLLKVRGNVPPEAGKSEKGTVIVTFTEFDASYKISAPR